MTTKKVSQAKAQQDSAQIVGMIEAAERQAKEQRMVTKGMESTRAFVGIQQDGEVLVNTETGMVVVTREKADFPVVVGVRVKEVVMNDLETLAAVQRHYAQEVGR